MIRQGLFYSSILFVGWSVLGRTPLRGHPLTRASAAFPIGALAWAMAGVLLLTAGLPYRPTFILGAGIMVLGAIFFFTQPRNEGRAEGRFPTWGSGATLGLAIIGAFLAPRIRLSYFCDDSFLIVFFGRLIRQDHGISPAAATQLSGFGIFLPLLQSAGKWLGIDYLWSLSLMLGGSLLGTWLGLLPAIAKKMFPAVGFRDRILPLLMAVLILLSSYFFDFQFFLIHNNILASMFFLLFSAGILFYYLEPEESGWLVLTGMGALGYALARLEGPLMILPGLCLLLATPGGRRIDLNRMLGVLFAIIVVWHLRMLALMKGANITLSPGLILLIDLLLAIPFIATLQKFWERTQPLTTWVSNHMVTMSFVLAVVVYRIDPKLWSFTWPSIAKNALFLGFWGITWVFIPPALVLARWLDDFRGGRVLGNLVSVYLLELLVLGFGQGGYRPGWGDSANRNITHVFPVALLYLAMVTIHNASKPRTPSSV